jgi:membrane protein DedA with SNARE-associated domain
MMATVHQWGYFGIIFLMALESSVVPIPSELIIPPAAYWASQGQLNMTAVILTGAFGSWIGSAISYLVSALVGRPIVLRYGKYFLMSRDKIEAAELWVRDFGVGGIFFARVLPVIRHLISIPAGICQMNFAKFSIATFLGAGLWCSVLAWFGPRVITPEMLKNADEMVHGIKAQTHYFVLLALLLTGLYLVGAVITRRLQAKR